MNAPDDALAELAAAEADAEEDADALADEADALELLEDEEQPAITNAAKANAATNAATNLNFLISSLPSLLRGVGFARTFWGASPDMLYHNKALESIPQEWGAIQNLF